MQKETSINEQTNNYTLNLYNLFTRGLRLSTKWIYQRVLDNKERKTEIKEEDVETQRDTEIFIITSRRHVVEIDIIMKN